MIESAGSAPLGPAVLDIGGGTGALLVIVPAALLHTEIEVSPAWKPRRANAHRRARAQQSGVRSTGRAVPVARRRDLDALGRGPLRNPPSVEIVDGQVTEVDWR